MVLTATDQEALDHHAGNARFGRGNLLAKCLCDRRLSRWVFTGISVANRPSHVDNPALKLIRDRANMLRTESWVRPIRRVKSRESLYFPRVATTAKRKSLLLSRRGTGADVCLH